MRGQPIPYSAAETEWLERHRLLPIQDYANGFRETFGRRDVEASHLHALRKRKGWRTGRSGCFEPGQEPANKGKPCEPGRGGLHPNARATQFRKGQEPHNTRHLGHERMSKDGYVEISVAAINPHTGYWRRYVHKHVYLWEARHGPVPDGMCLKCLDGDKANTDPANWTAIPRAVLARLNGGRHKTRIAYDEAPDEVKPAVLAAARLAHRVRRTRLPAPGASAERDDA